jgi:subtilase family serine protease
VARLTNVGRARSGIFSVKWFLDGAQVGYGQHASLGQGEVSNGNVRFTWTPTTGGSHNLRFVADVDSQVTELRELNNQSSLTFNLEILADLVVTGISFTSPPRPGTPTTAVARLVNAGTVASPSFNVKWFLDGVQVGYGNHAALGPGEVSNGNVRFLWTPTTGTHSLRFAADVDNYVRETNEANNSASVTVNVENLADLQVSRITFTSPPRAGVPTVAVAQLTNVGRAPSGYFNVKWFLDGAQVGYGGHTPLAPGEVSNGNVRLMWTPNAGTHTLRFAADVDGQVREYSETDNSASITIVVGQ